MNNENIELKPCPFCGNKPKLVKRTIDEMVDLRHYHYTLVGVECRECWFELVSSVRDEKDMEKVRDKRIKLWNTRI